MRHLILDIATSPLENAGDFITTDDISAPSNYRDPDVIKRYVDTEKAKRLEKAALDPDTCRITAVGFYSPTTDVACDVQVMTCRTEEYEKIVLESLLRWVGVNDPSLQLITFNGHRFDLPVLMRRCAYLGLPVPDINLDRYRSPHVDLFDRLTFRGAVSGHSLQWYAKRLGWTDLVKPLSGAEEARVPVTGRWDELQQSVRHDLTATHRLAQWCGILPKTQPEPVL